MRKCCDKNKPRKALWGTRRDSTLPALGKSIFRASIMCQNRTENHRRELLVVLRITTLSVPGDPSSVQELDSRMGNSRDGFWA
jgi:hypothetical protein